MAAGRTDRGNYNTDLEAPNWMTDWENNLVLRRRFMLCFLQNKKHARIIDLFQLHHDLVNKTETLGIFFYF